MEALKRSSSRTHSLQILGELRAQLASLSPEEASRAIRAMLDSKTNMPTRLGFIVGPGGFLKEAPSLRVFLLDQLGKVDPAGAAAYAETILVEMSSPEEWAVALRSYAAGRDTPAGRAFLTEKMKMLLQREGWGASASAGYLESFDVAVWLGGTELIPPLTTLVRQQDNRPVARAAYLALDRLTLKDATSTLGSLLADPECMKGREQTRANFFARADVGNLQQRQILERYLLAPDRSEVELRTFAGLYPNANYMVSDNLLTQVTTPDAAALARSDEQALAVVDHWMQEERFGSVRSHLEHVQRRLREVRRANPNR